MMRKFVLFFAAVLLCFFIRPELGWAPPPGGSHSPKVKPKHLKSVDTRNDGEIPSFDSATGLFEWVAPSAASFTDFDTDYGNETVTSDWDLSGANIELPNNTAPVSTDCDAANEAGRVTVDTDATSGQQLYVCEGLNGWVLQGDGGGGATTDGGAVTYVTGTTDDFAIGGTAASDPAGGSRIVLDIRDTTNGAALNMQGASSTRFGLYTGSSSASMGMISNHDLTLRTNDTARLSVEADGTVIIGGTTHSSNDPSHIIVTNVSNSTNYHGYVDESTLNATTNSLGSNSFDAKVTINGTENWDHVAGLQVRTDYGAGTISRFTGAQVFLTHDGGTATNVRGYEYRDILGTGNLTTQKAVYIETLSRGTNNYGVSMGDSDADQNILHAGVTGDPIIKWDESEDAWKSTKEFQTDAHLSAATYLQLGSLTDASASCIGIDTDRPYADKDCGGTKGAGEEYLDATGGGSGDITDVFDCSTGDCNAIVMGASDTFDGGGGTSFEIPNSATPTVNAAGEIAVDTTITSYDGLIKYYDGATEMTVVAMPTADLTTTDNHVVAYATGKSGFNMEAQAGGGGSVSHLETFRPQQNEPPTSAFATLDLRNNIPVLDFDDSATIEDAVFGGVMSNDYANGGLTVIIQWSATSATTGNVVWEAAIERWADDAFDIDADGFATENTATCTTASASGEVDYCTITFTDGADMDSLTDGEGFRIKISRDGDDASDTMTGDAELLRVHLYNT